jgi:hypothetical protein
MPSDTENNAPTPKNGASTAFDRVRPLLGITIGFAVLYGAMFGAYYFWRTLSERKLDTSGDLILAAVGMTFLVTAIYVGGRLVISATSTKRDVIPPEDRKLLEPLIKDSNEKAIEQYVRLSSLAGATGTATRLGLTGLPLITVALTLIFAALELYKPGGGFMDLTKLTLGAFIGSFVQRSATTQAVASAGRATLPL